MRTADERRDRLTRGNEHVVRHIMTRVAPLGLRGFFLVIAYLICLGRLIAYAIQEPFLRQRDRLLSR
jgi:hypothetical protein